MIIYFLTPKDQIWIIHNLIDRLDKHVRSSISAKSYHEFYESQDLFEGTVIFTGLGVLTEVQREIAIEIANQLTQSKLNFKLLNHPEKSLSRYDLLNVLYENGLNSFKAYRLSEVSPDQINYPVFLREEYNHTGALSDIIYNSESLKKTIETLQNRGFKKDHLLVVEYLKTSDDSGLFRKYSVQKFGDEIIPRYLSLDYHWVVKENAELPDGKELYTDERVLEEVQFMRENPHKEELRQIFEIAEIDFGRIDYGLLNGKIQTWEINTLPTFGGFPGRVKKNPKRKKRVESKRIFYDLMSQAVHDLANDPSKKFLSLTISNRLNKSISREKRRQAWVNATLWIGKKIPRLPFLKHIRAILRRQLRQKKER